MSNDAQQVPDSDGLVATSSDERDNRQESSLGRLQSVLYDMPKPNRLRLMVLVVFVPALATLLVVAALSKSFFPVVENATAEQFSSIVALFNEASLPYKVDGNRILVARDHIHHARLLIARVDHISEKMVGFELFDGTALEASRFGQQIAYKRAMEGELARTVKHLDNVAAVKVHLTMHERSVLTEEQVAASASVVVRLHPNKTLAEDDVLSIRTLVAGAVRGLEPKAVTVIDNHGTLLASGFRQPEDEQAWVKQNKMESILETKLNRVLSHAYPDGSAMAVVRADIDETIVKQSEETYDPEAVVVRSEERVGVPGATGAGGIAGAAARRGAGADGKPLVRQLTNYEVSRVSRETVRRSGGIKRLSAVVVLRSPAEQADLDRLRGLVAAAIGADPARGDLIEIVHTPVPVAVEAPVEQAVWKEYLPEFLKYLPLAIAAIFVHLWLVRPIRRVTVTRMPTLPLTVEEAQTRLISQPEVITESSEPPPPAPLGTATTTDSEQLPEVSPEIDPERLARTISRWMRAA